MRIKSYFAASVQSAIAMARREFGDEVTLVTSHIAAAESRHLGEYEVVFAIDEEPVPAPEPEQTPKFTEFQEALLGAVAKKPAQRSVLEQIESIRSTLIELGIEPTMVRALMTLVERSIDASALPEHEDQTGAMLSQLADSLSTEPELNPIQNRAREQAAEEALATTPESQTGLKFRIELPLNESASVPEPQPRMSAAELAFAMSVSEAPAPARR
jgi:hypothetical protein